MGFLTGVLLLVFSAVLSAADGDYSGILFIFKLVAGVGLFLLLGSILVAC